MQANNNSILVLNCGSSSVKLSLFEYTPKFTVARRQTSIEVSNIGGYNCQIECNGVNKLVDANTHQEAIWLALKALNSAGIKNHQITAVGHRIVHGGELTQPCLISPSVRIQIAKAASYAPVHNKASIESIEAINEYLRGCPQVAVFDTEFYTNMPDCASRYALKESIIEGLPAKRTGFHGISHRQASQRVAEYLGHSSNELKIISCHLGSACSIAAIDNGICIDTSMGMTPLEGLMMATRAGDIDPGIVLNILRDGKTTVDELDAVLNHQSGLLALTGTTDMRDIAERSTLGDRNCKNAIEIYVYRLRKYIGAYIACMGGVDALIFTGGVGEKSDYIRSLATQGFEFINLALSHERNTKAHLSSTRPIARISSDESKVSVFTVACDEALAIAKATHAVLANSERLGSRNLGVIPIRTSARHAHLTQDAISSLFGENHKLIPKSLLGQHEQFAAYERVTLVGPKGELKNVRVVGPARVENQIEISRTDANEIGINTPVRSSGDLRNTPGIKLVGPKGELVLECGVINAQRHIHMHPEDAARFNVEDQESVSISIQTGPRSLTFQNVQVKVDTDYVLELHLDTDEANAVDSEEACYGVLVKNAN